METESQAEAGDSGHGAEIEQRHKGERGDAGAPPKRMDEAGAVLSNEDVYGRSEGGAGL